MTKDELILQIYNEMKTAFAQGNVLSYAAILADKIMGDIQATPRAFNNDGQIIRRVERTTPVNEEVPLRTPAASATPTPVSRIERRDNVRISSL